jgi:hypothetical protein
MESRCAMKRSTVARTLVPVAVIGAVLAACRVEVSPPRERTPSTRGADTTMILAELRTYYRDFSARNWTAFAGHFWPGADLTTIWQPPGEDSARVVATSVPDFVAQAPRGPGSRAIFEERMLEARITTTGDLAQAWVRYRATFGNPGQVSEWEGTDAFTLLRHHGQWRIAALAFLASGPGS